MKVDIDSIAAGKQSCCPNVRHSYVTQRGDHRMTAVRNGRAYLMATARRLCLQHRRPASMHNKSPDCLSTVNYKNLAIANRSRVSCEHNTLRALIGLNITPWPWNLG